MEGVQDALSSMFQNPEAYNGILGFISDNAKACFLIRGSAVDDFTIPSVSKDRSLDGKFRSAARWAMRYALAGFDGPRDRYHITQLGRKIAEELEPIFDLPDTPLCATRKNHIHAVRRVCWLSVLMHLLQKGPSHLAAIRRYLRTIHPDDDVSDPRSRNLTVVLRNMEDAEVVSTDAETGALELTGFGEDLLMWIVHLATRIMDDVEDVIPAGCPHCRERKRSVDG